MVRRVTTHAATGLSRHTDTATATREAIDAARARLPEAPTLGFLFASSKHALNHCLATARAMVDCPFIASHTAGEFTEAGAMRGGLVVMLVSSNSLVTLTAAAKGVREDPVGVARQLGQGFGELAQRAASLGMGLSTSVLMLDALGGNGERVVKELLAHTRLFQQVVGGAAGDDGQFREAWAGNEQLAGPDVAAVAHVFDSKAWGIGVEHGLAPTTKPMTVTKARGSVLLELDGRPAFDVYREHAQALGVELTPENASTFLIGHELGVYFLDALHHARAALGVGAGGALQLIANVSEGAQVCLLDGRPDAMIEAVGRAAEAAKAHLNGAPAAGVLVFDCICRGMILGREFQREIDAVRRVFPEVPIAGFLSYGEIAKFRGKLDGWHNAAAVVAAIPS